MGHRLVGHAQIAQQQREVQVAVRMPRRQLEHLLPGVERVSRPADPFETGRPPPMHVGQEGTVGHPLQIGVVEFQGLGELLVDPAPVGIEQRVVVEHRVDGHRPLPRLGGSAGVPELIERLGEQIPERGVPGHLLDEGAKPFGSLLMLSRFGGLDRLEAPPLLVRDRFASDPADGV